MKHAVSLLLERSDGKVLAVSRKDDSTLFGLPGGKVNEEEDPDHALIREIKEEVGLILWSSRIKAVYVAFDAHDYCTTTYSSKYDLPEETINAIVEGPREGEGVVKWVDWEVLFAGPFGLYNKALFSYIKTRALHKK